MRIFRTELQVRGYELDGYRHVNHAVYLNYAEFARWRMIEEATGGSDYFKKHGLAPVIARAEADYKEPCFLAEWLVIETRLAAFRRRVAKFQQRILKRDTGRLAAEVTVTAMVLGSDGRSVALPGDFEKLFGMDGAIQGKPARETTRDRK